MNPNYRLQVDICLTKPRADDSIWMRLVKNIPFVPRNGDTIRLYDENEEDTLDLTLDDVVYDTISGNFTCDLSIDTMVENYSESGTCNEKEVVAAYVPFGFVRLTFPTAQVVRA